MRVSRPKTIICAPPTHTSTQAHSHAIDTRVLTVLHRATPGKLLCDACFDLASPGDLKTLNVLVSDEWVREPAQRLYCRAHKTQYRSSKGNSYAISSCSWCAPGKADSEMVRVGLHLLSEAIILNATCLRRRTRLQISASAGSRR